MIGVVKLLLFLHLTKAKISTKSVSNKPTSTCCEVFFTPYCESVVSHTWIPNITTKVKTKKTHTTTDSDLWFQLTNIYTRWLNDFTGGLDKEIITFFDLQPLHLKTSEGSVWLRNPQMSGKDSNQKQPYNRDPKISYKWSYAAPINGRKYMGN